MQDTMQDSDISQTARRGRRAAAPAQIPLRGWLDILWRVATRFGSVHVTLIAAGIAFYSLLALFPAMTAGVATVGLVYDPTVLVDQAGWVLAALPGAARTLIAAQLEEVAGSGSDALGLAFIISLGVALWSASAATGSLLEALNLIYEEEEQRGFIRLKLWTIALTLAMIVVLALSVIVVAAIPAVLALVGARSWLSEAALLLRWPLFFGIAILGISALYKWGPCRRPARWRWLTPGAFLACTLWALVTLGFSYYVQSFADYNETFGALGGVIVLLTWLWLSAMAVMLGALLDAELEAQTARDSTVGPDRPRGARGAIKADRLGPSRGEATAEDGTEQPPVPSR